MHILKKRQRMILGYLLGKEVPVTIKNIAENLQVSSRTVRYDLEDLAYWMLNKNLIIKKVPKKGIWIPDKEEVRQVLAQEDSVDEVKAYRILSKDERCRELLAILFSADEWVSVGTLAEAVGVSKSTCYNDMDRVKEWLEAHDLNLASKPHSGYRIDAKETEWRRGLMNFLEEIADSQDLMNLVTLNKKPEHRDGRVDFLRNREYHDMFSEMDLDRMVMFVEALEKRMEIRLLDSAYAALMIHIAVAIKRLREGEVNEMPQSKLAELRMFDAYEVVDEVLSKMNFLRFDDVPEAEVGYITAHIVAARMRDRKESYKEIKASEKPLDDKAQDLYDGILGVVMEHASVAKPEAFKTELKALIGHMLGS